MIRCLGNESCKTTRIPLTGVVVYQDHGSGRSRRLSDEAADLESPALVEGEKQSHDASSDSLASGTSWSLIGQVSPMIITVFLTPYILHGLGVVRYGLFVLTGSLVSFLGTFDGGVKGTAQRFFAIYAGAHDTRRTTRLLGTLLLVIATFGLVLSTAGWFLAGPIVSVIGVAHRYRAESVFLFRALGVLVTFSFVHNLFVSILQAHFRFAYIIKAGFAVYALWAVGLVLTVHFDWGLRGIALVFIIQQVFLTVVIMPASFRYLRREDLGTLSRGEVREFFGFASRVQISNLSSLINMEFDTIVIGAALSARAVSFYNAGANFGENVGAILDSALSPAQSALAVTFGRDGEAAAFDQFRRLQRIWVIGLSGWFAAACGAAYFAIVAWLGSDFTVGGVIAIIALLTQGVFLLSGVLRTFCTVSGRPGIQSRFGIFSVVVNIAFTIPLVFTGAIGVAAATAVGQLFGIVYLARLARRAISPDCPNPVRSVPVVPTLATAALVVVLEVAIRPVVPGGGFGLIACGVPAAVGLAFFLVAVVGPRQFLLLVRSAGRTARSIGPRGALSQLMSTAAGS
jgi:O-antigen/teichoic acid export membrane protein